MFLNIKITLLQCILFMINKILLLKRKEKKIVIKIIVKNRDIEEENSINILKTKLYKENKNDHTNLYLFLRLIFMINFFVSLHY